MMKEELLPKSTSFRAMRALAASGMALALSACAVGPDYQRPAMDLGQAYKQSSSALQAAVVDAGVNPGWIPAASSAPLRGDWWLLFDDPMLSGLMRDLNSANLNIAQAEAQYRQAQAQLQGARAGFFPTVGASSSASRSGTGSAGSSSGSSSVSNQYSLSGTVSWEPDLWGRISRTVEAGEAGLQAGGADLAATRLSMQSTLAQTYFDLRVTDAERRLLQQTVQAYTQSLALTRNRYDAGIAAQADIETSTAQLENARAQALALDRQRAQLENAIAVLLGRTPAEFSLPETTVAARVPVVPVELPSELLLRRPDVIAAERRTAQANARIGVAQAAWFPNLALTAQGGFRSGQWAQWLTAPASFWSLGPALALTIFDGGAREAQLREARAAYDAQAANYRQTALTALREVEDYLVQLSVLGHEQVVQGRALAAARESLRLTQNQYQAGLIDYLSVVQVETTALNAERSALALVAGRLAASVQLIAALGGGWNPEAGTAGPVPVQEPGAETPPL